MESALIDHLVSHCQAAKFTGILYVRASEGIGEVWFLSGVADEVQFGVSKADEAMDRMRRATNATYELVSRLPHPSGGFKRRFLRKGSVATATPVTLMRYCEQYALTCTLAVESGDVLVEAKYDLGDLVSVETTADDDGITSILEAEVGTYEFTLPHVELPEGTPVQPPASSSLLESMAPAESLSFRALLEAKPGGRAASDEAEVKRKTVELAGRQKVVRAKPRAPDVVLRAPAAAAPRSPEAAPPAPAASPRAPEASPRAPAATSPRAPEASPRAPAASPRAPEASPRAPAASPRAPAASPRAPEASPRAPAASPRAPAASPRAPEASEAKKRVAVPRPAAASKPEPEPAEAKKPEPQERAAKEPKATEPEAKEPEAKEPKATEPEAKEPEPEEPAAKETRPKKTKAKKTKAKKAKTKEPEPEEPEPEEPEPEETEPEETEPEEPEAPLPTARRSWTWPVVLLLAVAAVGYLIWRGGI